MGGPASSSSISSHQAGSTSQPISLSDLEASSHNNDDDNKGLVGVDADAKFYLTGWRLYALNFALCLSLFLSTLESTIVSTALVAITNSLDGFERSSWIVTAYLLTYTGFLTIVAKLSDIFGRKTLLVTSLLFFAVFSVGCGAAQSIESLIILRAFQGIGGGGIYTMVFVILPEMVTPQQYPTYAAVLSSTFALSNLLGPIVGGLIVTRTTWRWIFYLNGPAGLVALVPILICLPRSFPHPPDFVDEHALKNTKRVKRLDWLGFFLILAASVSFVAAIEEGGTEFPWNNVAVLAPLIISLLLWLAIPLWSRYQDQRSTKQESILPWRLISNRFSMAPMLNAFFAGAGFISLTINLPQKFQVVYGDSPFEAGYRLLALTVATPVGSALSGVLLQRLKYPPLYVLVAGGVLQVIGLALMTSLNEGAGKRFPAAEYGYEVITGIGLGFSLSTVIMMSPLVFQKRDMAVGIGAVGQFRVLGGSIAIAVCTNILNNHVSSELKNVLPSVELQSLKNSIQNAADLPPEFLVQVREAYLGGYQKEIEALVAFGAASILVSLLMIEKKPRWQRS